LITAPAAKFWEAFPPCGASKFVPFSSGKKPGPVKKNCAPTLCTKDADSSKTAMERTKWFTVLKVAG
jgi:hypothetical protein